MGFACALVVSATAQTPPFPMSHPVSAGSPGVGIGWSAKAADFNNDGREDVAAAYPRGGST